MARWIAERAAVSSLHLAMVLTALMSCRGEAPQVPEPAPRERDLTFLEHARSMAARMPDPRFRAELLAELAVAEHERTGRTRLEVELLAEAVDGLKAIPSLEDRDIAAARIAVAHASTDAIDTALDVASTVRAVEPRSTALARIAALTANAGAWERSAAIAERIEPTEPKGEALAAAAAAAAKANRWEPAHQLAKRCTGSARALAMAGIAKAHVARQSYKTAQQIADSLESGHFKGEVYAAIAVHYYATKNRERAEDAAQRIESSWLQARAYAEMAKHAFGAGERKRADRLFEKALGIVAGINDGVMKSAALEDLAALGLEIDKARAVADMPGLCPTRDARNRIYAKIVMHSAEKGKVEDAQATAALITGDPVSLAEALGAVAIARSKAGDDGGALETLEAVPSLQLRIGPAARVVIAGNASERPISSATLAHLAAVLELQPKSSQPERLK